MNHLMFDVDGTLVESYEFDERLFMDSVKEVTGITLINDWETYPDVTDRGILKTFIERQLPGFALSNLEESVKEVFVSKVREYLIDHPATEVNGAIAFINSLRERKDVVLSIATGGWGETAIAKLESAGFNIEGIPLASSNEHHSRIEIMNLAKFKAINDSDVPLTYFGDAEWDKSACAELGVNLIIVGDRAEHHQSIADFNEIETALEFAGVVQM